jgi:ProP effector
MSVNKTVNQAAKQDKLNIINWLIEQFPAAFFKKTRYVKPLKLGILEDIFEIYHQITPPFSKKSLRNALTYYCTSPAYLSAQKPNKPRIDLYGNEMELVTSEQAKYAKIRYERQYLSPQSKPTFQASVQPTDNLHPAVPPEALPSE